MQEFVQVIHECFGQEADYQRNVLAFALRRYAISNSPAISVHKIPRAPHPFYTHFLSVIIAERATRKLALSLK